MNGYVVIGLLGASLDRGDDPERWSRWRPTVSLCQHEDLLIKRLELLCEPRSQALADQFEFPDDAKSEAGYQFRRVQSGLEPSNWKPMKSVGTGVKAIRIFEESGMFRVLYVANLKGKLHVLHAFQKTEKTEKHDIQLAKARLKAI